MEALAVLLVAYLFLMPLAALIIALRLRGRIRSLEEALERTRTLVRAAREKINAAPPRTPEEPAPAPEAAPAPAPPAVPSPEAAPPPPPPVVAAAKPSPETPPQARPGPPPPPRPVAPKREFAPPAPTLASKALPFLRDLGMMPPPMEGRSRESVIMQWWLPRIGGLLALLTALFFGVYINQSTSPLVKLLELLGASLGLCALGLFLERKHKAFGGVILVTGLIMLYLTSVSAYLLPAVKVIQSPLLGALTQAAALALIVAVGLRRRSEGIVLLAYHFGFILGVFMAWEGLREGALLEALLLLSSGVFISQRWQFHKLPWVIIPAVFLVPPAFALLGQLESLEVPRALSVHLYLNLALLAAPALYLFGGLKKVAARRALVAVATSGAVFGAFTFFRTFFPGELADATLYLGLQLLVWAAVAWTRERYGAITLLFLVKGSSLLSIWVILTYAGDLRWMILGVQSVVLAFSARHARRFALELTVAVVAVISIYFFMTGGGQLPPAGELLWWLVILYPALFYVAALVMLPGFEQEESPSRNLRRACYFVVPLVVCGLWYPLFEGTPERGFALSEAFAVVMFATALPALLAFFSRFLAGGMTAVAFTLTCLLFWDQPYAAAVVAAIVLWSAAALWLLGRQEGVRRELAESAIYLLSLPALTGWLLFVTRDWSGQGAVAYAFAAVLLMLGRLKYLRHLGGFSLLPPAVYLVTVQTEAPGRWTILTLLIGLGWILLPSLDRVVHRGLGWARQQNIWMALASLLLWAHFLAASKADFGWYTWQLIALLTAAALLASASSFRNSGLLVGGLAFSGGAMANHLATLVASEMDWGIMPWGWEALASMATLIAVLLPWHLFARPARAPDDARNAYLHATSGTLVGASLFLLSIVTFRYERLSWDDYYTPLLAATAFALILIGLFQRDRPLRYVGLVALLLPLGRLFVVDVQDALYRIIAFGAAAALLTLLGYLYHRLSKRVEESEVTPTDNTTEP
jgi:hypothetical protein